MKHRSLTTIFALALMLASLVARAQDGPSGNDLAKMVAPAVTPATLAVVHIDLQRLDLEAVQKTVTDLLRAVEPDADVRQKHLVKDMDQAMASVRKVREAGARHAFAVIALDGDFREPLFNYLPVAENNARRLVDQLNAITAELGRPDVPEAELERQKWPVAAVLGSGVYFGPRPTLRRLKEAKPQERPSLAQAFTAAGDAPVALALAPSEDLIKALGALAPSLPNRMGGAVATEQLITSVKWLALGANVGKEQRSLKLVIQTADASSAKAMQLILAAVQGQVLASLPAEAGAVKEAIAELRPKADEAHRLTLTIEGKTAGGAFGEGVVAGLKNARENARMAQAANHVRQLLLACHMYASDRNGEWPESFQQLVDLKYLDRPDVLKNPRSEGGAGSFVYVRPKVPMNKHPNTTGTVMIHEPLQGVDPAKFVVGFVDGHVEFLPKAEAEKRMAGEK